MRGENCLSLTWTFPCNIIILSKFTCKTKLLFALTVKLLRVLVTVVANIYQAAKLMCERYIITISHNN